MVDNIIKTAFVGFSVIFTSLTLLCHTYTAVKSQVTADDQSDADRLSDSDPQSMESGGDPLVVPAFDDPGSLYQNLSPISHAHLPRVAIGIVLSSNKLSKSGMEPFTINFQLANVTSHILALSNLEPVKSVPSSVTNGPIIRITEQSIRGAIAQYRLEVCSLEELATLVLAFESAYQSWKGFSRLQPLRCSGCSAWINNTTNGRRDTWCEDLKNKLIVGLSYRVDVITDDRLLGSGLINGNIRIESLNRDTPSFEVVD